MICGITSDETSIYLTDIATNQVMRVMDKPDKKEPCRKGIEEELDEKIQELDHVLNRLN